MDFSFDSDQEAFRREVRAFAERELAPHYQSDDKAARMRPELPRQLASIGVTGLRIPERFGGGEADAVTTGMVAEELSRADINACYLLLITALNSDILVGNGTEEQLARWLPPIADGTQICALGLILDRSLDSDLETVLAMEAMAHGIVKVSKDHAEGVAAFFEKRKPTFTGE